MTAADHPALYLHRLPPGRDDLRRVEALPEGARYCRVTRLSLAVAASSAICNLYHQVGYILIFLDLIFTIWVLITSQYANLRNWPTI